MNDDFSQIFVFNTNIMMMDTDRMDLIKLQNKKGPYEFLSRGNKR